MTYFDGIEATLYENWPDALRGASMKTRSMALETADALALGSVNPAFRDRNGLGRVSDFSSGFTAWLEGALAAFPDGAFIKTSYGSFRECPFSFRPSRTVPEAMSVLRWPDDRIMRHAQQRLDFGGVVHVLVREWHSLATDQEFRVFVRGGRIVAITPIYHRQFEPRILDWSSELNTAIRTFVNSLIPELHYDPIAFDLWVDYSSGIGIGLTELSPFMTIADPGLFDWHDPATFDGRFRLRARDAITEIKASA